MVDASLDMQERLALCDLFDELGPSAPTLLDGWTAHDLAAHLVLRERDVLAGPCLVLPGPFQRFAEWRRTGLARRKDFPWLVGRLRSGPPVGFFRIGWVRDMANLNEFFVHHEDVRRANGRAPRALSPDMDTALWRNVRRGGPYLGRRLQGCGLEVEWAGATEAVTLRAGSPTARLGGQPGELLLYLFGRQNVAHIEVSGTPEAVTALRRTHFGM
ncbi:TIGR03085 family metal-binding protein [Mycobacterium colombiense]|uniref:TIGR03085 family metal-binding protein n=1 Tax=Mycobacterium colombiense TaxID=339268 RepID=UPI0008011D14|nr:TIGR03085 family metal-binding protein [Mycobacterium colombiense]OBJ65826.1 TIGR03085 family protein [Mycobacterium colombiense]